MGPGHAIYSIQVADRRAPPCGSGEKPALFNPVGTSSDYADDLYFLAYRDFESTIIDLLIVKLPRFLEHTSHQVI